MKRPVVILLMSAVGVLAFIQPALAHDARPGCHGANELPCRPDPQPTHGNDCTRSDDHRCLTAPTTTSSGPRPTSTTTTGPLSTTTSTLPTASTITTTPAQLPSQITPTMQVSDTTTTVPQTMALLPGAVSPASATTDGQLAVTGAGTEALTFLGLWLVVGGVFAIVFGKIARGN